MIKKQEAELESLAQEIQKNRLQRGVQENFVSSENQLDIVPLKVLKQNPL
jgi:hypothetical protein